MSDATGVIVLGTGLPELAAALEFATYGVPVTILADPSADPGLPLTPQIDTEGVLATWITESTEPLREGADPACTIVSTGPGSGYVKRQGSWVKVPQDSVFGIPSSPLSTEVTQAIGAGGAFRAYVDRLLPVLKIGKTQFVDELVRKRVGRKVLDTFVEPQVAYLFGRPSNEVEVAALAPGLNEAETRVGTLTGAALFYLDRYERLAGGVTPNSGWSVLREVLLDRLDLYGAKVVKLETALQPEQVQYVPASDDGDTQGWQVTQGAHVFQGSVLAAPRDPLSTGAVSQRITLSATHAVPEWWPGAGVAGEFSLQQLGSTHKGWTAKTAIGAGGNAVTEIRSQVQQLDCDAPISPDELAVTEWFALAGLEPKQLSAIQVTVAPPLAATDEHAFVADEDASEAEHRAHMVTTGQVTGERGLAQAIAQVLERSRVLRLEVLGLT